MTNTVNDQPLYAALQLTDYLLAWQGAQSPPTRKLTISGLNAYYLQLTGGQTVSGNVTFSGNLTGSGTVVVPSGTTGNRAVNFSQFAPHLAPLGHISLPGAILVNWGLDTQGISGGRTITFDKQFASAIYAVIPGSNGSNAPALPSFDTFNGPPITTMVMHAPTGGNYWWVAIGT